jgi:hypothetical protein
MFTSTPAGKAQAKVFSKSPVIFPAEQRGLQNLALTPPPKN